MVTNSLSFMSLHIWKYPFLPGRSTTVEVDRSFPALVSGLIDQDHSLRWWLGGRFTQSPGPRQASRGKYTIRRKRKFLTSKTCPETGAWTPPSRTRGWNISSLDTASPAHVAHRVHGWWDLPALAWIQGPGCSFPKLLLPESHKARATSQRWC